MAHKIHLSMENRGTRRVNGKLWVRNGAKSKLGAELGKILDSFQKTSENTNQYGFDFLNVYASPFLRRQRGCNFVTTVSSK